MVITRLVKSQKIHDMFDQLRSMNLNDVIRLNRAIYEDTKGVFPFSTNVENCGEIVRSGQVGKSWSRNVRNVFSSLEIRGRWSVHERITFLTKRKRIISGDSFGKASNIFFFFFFTRLKKTVHRTIHTRSNLVIIRFQTDPASSIDNKYYRTNVGE